MTNDVLFAVAAMLFFGGLLPALAGISTLITGYERIGRGT